MMRDPKEDYYFHYVPEREAENPNINWQAYKTLLNVVLTYSALDARLARFLAQWDLFPSAFNLLTMLSRADGNGMHLSRISELLAVSRANVTGLVDVLARKGLVNRMPSATDRRVRLAILTDKGQALIQEILPKYYAQNSALANQLNPEDCEIMVRALTQIRVAIGPEPESQPSEDEAAATAN